MAGDQSVEAGRGRWLGFRGSRLVEDDDERV
jgi:hypothetical protein